nr:MAG TPA: hypothetical protein [Caudoviricetes sp.]
MRVHGKSVTRALIDAPRLTVQGLVLALPLLIERQSEELAFRIYVTNCAKILTENTAKSAGGSYLTKSYLDIINPPPPETRTPEQVKQQILGKLKDAAEERNND